MSDAAELKGKCLCGGIRITAANVSRSAGACHCGMCRRWGGGPLMAVDCGVDVSIDGKDNLSVFESSSWAERGFCNKCGSHLFYRLKGSGQYMVPAGVLGGQQAFVFDHQVFIDEKPSYYSFANETNDMTGAELFAKYGATD